MTTRFGLLAFLIALVLPAAPSQAAEPPAAASLFPPVRQRVIETHDLKSAQGPHRIFISRPAGPAPANGFPVIYVVDGNAWFGVTAEVARLNEGSGPSVVVGIGYPTESLFDLQGRMRDFTPPAPRSVADPRLGPLQFGGVEPFRTLIRDEVKPLVEREIKIDRTRQALVGHSLGGLFVLGQMFADPAAFQTYVAASPSIHFNDRTILKSAEAFMARQDKPAGLRLLVTVGELEQGASASQEAEMRALVTAHPQYFPGQSVDQVMEEWKADRARERMVDNARELAASLKAAGVDTSFASFPDEDHLTAAVVGINRGVGFILKPRN